MSPRDRANYMNFSGFLSDTSNPMRFSDIKDNNEYMQMMSGFQSSNIRSQVDLH